MENHCDDFHHYFEPWLFFETNIKHMKLVGKCYGKTDTYSMTVFIFMCQFFFVYAILYLIQLLKVDKITLEQRSRTCYNVILLTFNGILPAVKQLVSWIVILFRTCDALHSFKDLVQKKDYIFEFTDLLCHLVTY